MKEKVSFVVPMYNEEDNVGPLCESISSAMKDSDHPFEMILVNDGSRDQTWKRMHEAGERYRELVAIDLLTNYGQSPALAAGIDKAEGELIVLMDGDLQNDPADVPMMIDTLISGDLDMVAGERVKRKDKAISRKIPSRIANFMIRMITGVKLKDYGCALRVFRREVARNLGLYGELHRYINVLAVLQGARVAQVPVLHHPRKSGKSKYGLGRTLRVVSDLVLIMFFQRYQNKPMHIFGTLGIITFGAGAIIDLYFFVLKLLGNDIWGKPLLLLGFILTIGGIQIITTGIIAEILMRTYYESQNKKPYQVKRTIERED